MSRWRLLTNSQRPPKLESLLNFSNINEFGSLKSLETWVTLSFAFKLWKLHYLHFWNIYCAKCLECQLMHFHWPQSISTNEQKLGRFSNSLIYVFELHTTSRYGFNMITHILPTSLINNGILPDHIIWLTIVIHDLSKNENSKRQVVVLTKKWDLENSIIQVAWISSANCH